MSGLVSQTRIDPGDKESLLSGKKFTRRARDNTVVVFYHYVPNQANDALQPLIRQYAEEAYGEIETICDKKIRFFNIDALTKEQQAYLKKQRVAIPVIADTLIVCDINLTENVAGEAGYPRRSDTDAPSVLRVDSTEIMSVKERITEDAKRIALFQKPGFLKHVIFHEVGHSVGLKHPFSQENASQTVLPEERDIVDNTVMSYRRLSKFGSYFTPVHYQELDAQALQEMYGKAPENALNALYVQWHEEDKQNEAQASITKAGMRLRDFVQRLVPASGDAKKSEFTPAQFAALQKKITDFIEQNYSEYERTLLQQRDPDFGKITLTDVPQAGGDFILLDMTSIGAMVGNFKGFPWQDGHEFAGGENKIEVPAATMVPKPDRER